MTEEQRAIWNAGAEAMREVAAERLRQLAVFGYEPALRNLIGTLAVAIRALPLPEPEKGA
jgi:hypothetical protein